MPTLQVGMSKLKAVTRHKDVLPHQHSSIAPGDTKMELNFRMAMADEQLPPPMFNVLYVQTPRIGLLQAPLFRAFAQTCAEAADLVKPILRLGIRETSLFDKCPHYDPEFSKGPSGSLMATRRTREVLYRIRDGSLYEECHKHVPKERVYIRDFPNAFTVLLLNLGAYYLITRQSNRLRGI